MGNALAIREVHDLLLAAKPDEAKHRTDLCVICTDQAASSAASGTPPDVSDTESTEGGATPTMTTTQQEQQTISMDAHAALVRTEVEKACETSDKALAAATDRASTAEARVTELETQLASVQTELTDSNAKRDEDAVKINTLTEENAQLKKDIADAASAKTLAEKASERTTQVTNLKLFDAKHVTEKAEKWAKLSDEDWAEQLETWKLLKPASGETPGDEASAMTGGDGPASTDSASATDSAATPGDGTQSKSARRAVLGLGAK